MTSHGEANEQYGTPGAFLRGSHIGPKEEERKNPAGKRWGFDPVLVWREVKAVPFDPNDDKNGIEGDLLAAPIVYGLKAKTSLVVLDNSAATRSIAEWARICGIEAQDIVDLAREFVSHGRKAVWGRRWSTLPSLWPVIRRRQFRAR